MITGAVASSGKAVDHGRAQGVPTEKIAWSGTHYFAKHVFCCIEGRHAVLLDLKRDKYLCVPRARLDACGHRLSGWATPHEDGPATSPASDNEADVTLRAMLQQGVLTTRVTERNPAVPTSHPLPTTSLAPVAGHASRGGYTLSQFCNFAIAATLASASLRWRRLENVVDIVARRRARRSGAQDIGNLDSLRELVRVFDALRPIFPRPYLCLYDSLALLAFLASYDRFPRWVFGVRMDPFNAHCWVQAGEVVLNETVDEVRSYTPIMVV